MLNSLINVDLHIHSAASAYKEESGLVTDSDASHVDTLLDALTNPVNDIKLFSITDHNRFDPDLYRVLTNQIAERALGISLLAGVEFDVLFEDGQPDVHVITIFDARDEDDWQRIKEAIDKDMLHDRGENYSLSRYGAILCDINLPTILIAHQHNGFNAGNQHTHTLSAGTSEAESYYKFGFIDALEFSSPKVEAILRSELHDLRLPARMLVGSDCHAWAAYPRHDLKAGAKGAACMRIRALHTFKGLLLALTSPETRIGAHEYEESAHRMKSIQMCGKEIPLSPGINVIIGENGVGKSSLLELMVSSRRRKSYISSVKEAFEIEIPEAMPEEECIKIAQGDLQKKYWNGSLFEPGLFQDVDNSLFENAVAKYSDSLRNRVAENIDANVKKTSAQIVTFRPNIALEGGGTHYVRAEVDNGFTEISNPFAEAVVKLRTIKQLLEDEARRVSAYEPAEMTKIESAKKLIAEILTSVGVRDADARADAKARNYVHVALEDYEAKVSEKSSTADNDVVHYKAERASFVNAVTTLADLDTRAPLPPLKGISIDGRWGATRNELRGFTFVKAAAYASAEDITNDFLITMFNAGYQSQSKIEQILSEQEIIAALTGATSGSWREAWKKNSDKFIAESEKVQTSILDLDDNGIGGTLGEEALTYFKYQTTDAVRDGNGRVLMADQPEDNISNVRISKELISYFNKLRGKSQVILVTHNPLLVVNQDVDNVIVMLRDDGKPKVLAGCLESEESDGRSILDYVAEIMDGGREAVRRRLKAYGSEDHPVGR